MSAPGARETHTFHGPHLYKGLAHRPFAYSPPPPRREQVDSPLRANPSGSLRLSFSLRSNPALQRRAPALVEILETRIAPAFVSGTLNLADLTGANGSTFTGTGAEQSGTAVSGAGDVNGDGFDDFLIGASAKTYVIFGRGAGFPEDVSLGNLTGIVGFQITGGVAFDGTRAAGDVNGDGFGDIIVGDGSASHVIFGKKSGFPAQVAVSALDGKDGFTLTGAGNSVSGAGDVNRDGFADVIVGNFNADGKGAAYIIFGKSDGFAATLAITAVTTEGSSSPARPAATSPASR